MYINDGTEFSIGGKKSGFVIRYRGKIRGIMFVVRDFEVSFFSFAKVNYLSWNNQIRFGSRTKVW